MSELKQIYDDKNMKTEMCIEAGLAYARAAQTLQMRPGVYPAGEGIDFNRTYEEIITQHPTSSAAVFAAIYQAQGWFNAKDEKTVAQGFARLKEMLKNYSGPNSYQRMVQFNRSETD